jgi:formylmethanofuran dehydrogenase subunit B
MEENPRRAIDSKSAAFEMEGGTLAQIIQSQPTKDQLSHAKIIDFAYSGKGCFKALTFAYPGPFEVTMATKNVVCPACGVCCDDIQIEFGENGLIVKNACKIGHAKFQEIVCDHRIMEPMIREKGGFGTASWMEAIRKAGRILADAKRPLIFLGSEITCEAMEAGLQLGEFLGGVVDSTTSVSDGPTVMGVQEAGRVGATAGQSKIRSDLAVYWSADPLESLPRQMSLYAIYPRGYWTRRGWLDRTIITVDSRKTPVSKISDLHLQPREGTDYELLSALLTLLHGKTPHKSVEGVTGISVSQMKEMLDTMKGCNHGVLYLGFGTVTSCGKHRNAELALHLVKELNNFTKFTLGSLRSYCNTSGFNQTASSLYGYPFGLDFARGYPRYNPGEFTTVDLLREREVDAALLVSSNLDAHLPAACLEYLVEIPSICIDAFHSPITLLSDVVLPGVIDAIECEGTIYRLDDVPLYANPISRSPFHFTESNEHTIKQLFEEVREIMS